MRDENFVKIKNRMLKRSMELWGIKNKRNVDPVVDLLLHVFSHEISKLYEEVKVSDTQLLNRLSRILVSNKWTLPTPAHGLLSAQPTDETCELLLTDHFYCPKKKFGEGFLDVFFTPIITKELINASVKYVAYDKYVLHDGILGNVEEAAILSDESKIEDYTVWVGVEVSDEMLRGLEDFSMCFTMDDPFLLPYLRTMKIFNAANEPVEFVGETFVNEHEEAHYFDEVISFYEDCFYKVSLKDTTKVKKTLGDVFKDISDVFIDETQIENEYVWFKIELPEVFSKKELSSFNVSLNTFPVVNRKLEYKQHNFRKNGKILSMPSDGIDYFLNVDGLNDDAGNHYVNILKNNNEDTLEGGYSLYFGDIGKFDSRSAKMMLSKMSQTVREEGSAFSSIGYDIINAYLDDLNEKLNEVDKKIFAEFGNINANNEKSFLLTYPYENAFNYELQYWLTNAEIANGFNKNDNFNQYKTGKFNGDKIKLRTETVGGHIRKEEQDKINGLRYGLLTRDRIVTKEDVKSFVRKNIGRYTKEITIQDGVAISTEKKKGIIRVTEVLIETKDEFLGEERRKQFSYYLEKELQKRSISNTTYKIIFN